MHRMQKTSQKVEKIYDMRVVETPESGPKKEYYCKREGVSHRHCQWLPEEYVCAGVLMGGWMGHVWPLVFIGDRCA